MFKRNGIFVFVLSLLPLLGYPQTWTLKLMSSVEKDGKGLSGATIQLFQGSKLVSQSLSGGDGDFTLEIPPNGDFMLVVSYGDCNTKKFQVSTIGVPPEIGDDRFRPSFEIGGVTMAKPLYSIDYSALSSPLVKIAYMPDSKKFDHDENHTTQMLAALGKIKEAEKALIQKQQETCKSGDEALKKKDCDLAKQFYDKAIALIPQTPYETYPKEQLLKVKDCLGKKEAEAKKQNEEAAAKAAAEKAAQEKAEADRLAKQKAEADKLASEKAAKEKAEKDKEALALAAAAKAEADRLAKEKASAEKLAAEQSAKEKADKEKAEKEQQAAAKKESDRLAKEKAASEKLQAEKAVTEQAAAEKAEQTKQTLATTNAEAEKTAKEKAEREKAAKEKAEKERQAATEKQKKLDEEKARAEEKATLAKNEEEKKVSDTKKENTASSSEQKLSPQPESTTKPKEQAVIKPKGGTTEEPKKKKKKKSSGSKYTIKPKL